MWEQLLDWDTEIFIYLNNLGSEPYDAFWSTATNITTWIPLFILFFVLVWVKYPRKQALWVTLIIVAFILFITGATNITKELVERLRPNNDPGINALIRILKRPISYSFFSGHASTSFGVTTLVVLFLRKRVKWVWLFYLWPFIFAYSRIYVGVHFPLDILIGTTVGLLSAILFYSVYKRSKHPAYGKPISNRE